MGANFISVCHKCKVRLFFLRCKLDNNMTKFYKNHYSCGKENKENVETLWDYFDDREFEDYEDVFDQYNQKR